MNRLDIENESGATGGSASDASAAQKALGHQSARWRRRRRRRRKRRNTTGVQLRAQLIVIDWEMERKLNMSGTEGIKSGRVD